MGRALWLWFSCLYMLLLPGKVARLLFRRDLVRHEIISIKKQRTAHILKAEAKPELTPFYLLILGLNLYSKLCFIQQVCSPGGAVHGSTVNHEIQFFLKLFLSVSCTSFKIYSKLLTCDIISCICVNFQPDFIKNYRS